MIKEQKTITIINQDSGYLMIDLANAFVEKGYHVNLITGRLVQRNNKLHSTIKTVKIIKYNRSSSFKRLFTWSIGTLQLLFLAWFKFQKSELLIVSNPPTATLLPVLIKNTYSLLIYDVYPDTLVEYKIVKKNSLLIKKWEKANRSIFKNAKTIVTLNEGMKDRLSKYISSDKIEIVSIWTDNTFLKPILKSENSFLNEHKLQDKFIIMYSGNLGKTHNIEILVDLAEKLKNEAFYILIIGGGTQYKNIHDLILDKNLKNIKLLPWQPVEKLPFTLTSADISIVSLGSEASSLSIPSKIFNLMSVGSCIISISNSNSALAKLVKAYRVGENFENSDIQNMCQFVLKLQKDTALMNFYTSNSLEASKSFGPNNAFKIVNKCI